MELHKLFIGEGGVFWVGLSTLMYKSHEVAEGAFVGSMARHGPIFMDGVCVVLDRRKEWRERLRWGLLVFVIVDVKVGSGENSVGGSRA